MSGGYRGGPRDPFTLVGCAERDAIERAIASQLNLWPLRLFVSAVRFTASWSYLWQFVIPGELSAAAGVPTNHGYAMLKTLDASGVLVWREAPGHRGRYLVGLVDPDEDPLSWFTPNTLPTVRKWAVRELKQGGPRSHRRYAEILAAAPVDLEEDAPAASQSGLTESVNRDGQGTGNGDGLNQSAAVALYREVREVQESDRVHNSLRAPDGARRWQPVKRGPCIVCETFTQVDGYNLCEEHAEEAAA